MKGWIRSAALAAVCLWTAAPMRASATTETLARTITQVDLGEVIEPLLGLRDFGKIYHGTMRNLDYTAGCSGACPVCYVDAQPLSAAFRAESVLGGLRDASFRGLLALNMRPGLLSDPMDHARVEDLTMGLLHAIEGKLSYNSSVPPGSVDRTKDVLRHWRVDVDISDVATTVPEIERTREYFLRADEARPTTSLRPELTKFAIWLAHKPNNRKRIERLFGGSIAEWGIGIPGGFYAVSGFHPRFVNLNDYHASRSIALGRVLEGHGLRMTSPETDPLGFDCINYPHTAETIRKGKFVVTPEGAFMVVNVPRAESPIGKHFIRITKDNYRELGTRYLLREPNPVYINDYKPNPHYRRTPTRSVPRHAVLGFAR